MAEIPKDWPQISSAAYYREPAKMIDWLCEAFGFEIRIKIEGEPGQIVHSELTYGSGLIMVSGERTDQESVARFGVKMLSPLSLDRANTQGMMIYVVGIDAHFARAKAAGATIVSEVSLHDYGDDYWADRSYGCVDPEYHGWWFTERVRG